MPQIGLVFVGIAGHVAALDRASGQEVWRADLKGDFVNVALLDGDLYAAARGELFCLDPATGHIRWRNPLKGLGRGLLTIAAGSQQAVLLREKRQRDAAAAAAASSGAD